MTLLITLSGERFKGQGGPHGSYYRTFYKPPLIMLKVLEHFLPPGVAHTTGLPHNPFTWRPL